MSRTTEKGVEILFFCSAFFSAFLTLALFGFMLTLGLPLFAEGRFFSILIQPWAPHLGHFGIHPMIAGTLAISLLSMVFAFPLSLGCAILISVTSKGWTSRLLRKAVEMMTGIPTVIYGFVGIFLLVPLVREFFAAGSGMCVLTASLMLTLLVSPTMILFFCDSFERVPVSYGTAVLAVGGTEMQRFLHVTLPHSWPGILIGFTLAIGRALGDTLIALMIAGNAVQAPGSILDSARTLTAHIALVFAADFESLEFKAIFACGMFLYLLTTLLVMAVRLLGCKRKRWAR
ncbi:MAG: ABC transporter permease subunit [Desulfobulbaceae bacterium]|jgi:phosphate transport system permease protein|nr:ABC transporter permease subunit [Desulfobulbaceae bacterium]MDY0350048.1 ABC transporter permease subunit [Desulfobulbaceae bacterium]